MTISRLEPISRTYSFTPRLTALIELIYGTQADSLIANAVIEALNLPKTLLIRQSRADDFAGKLVDKRYALVDVNSPSLQQAVNRINNLTGVKHVLVCVPPDLVDEVSEYDRLYSLYSDTEQVTALINSISETISQAEYSI